MLDFPFKTSFWFDPEIETTPALAGNQLTDVAIIGGGFAGLAAASQLRQTHAGLRIALLEANHIGYGASGRAAGWLVNLPPVLWLLGDFTRQSVLDNLQFVARMKDHQLSEVGRLVAQEAIDCDWTETQHVLVARNRLETAILLWVAPRLKAVGIDATVYEQRRAQQFVGYPAQAALAFNIRTIQPYKLARGLRDWLRRNRVDIYEHTPVTRLEPVPDGMRIVTAGGATITAHKVVMATNAYTGSIGLPTTPPPGFTVHTYMLATEPLDQARLNRISAMLTPFGDVGASYYIGRIYRQRLLFNGIDRFSSNTAEDDRHLPSFNRLYAEMIRRFPLLRDVALEAAWGGAVRETRAETPIVRPSTDYPALIYNVGYGGGSGIGMALLSGRLTTDLILGRESHDADAQRLRHLFANQRFPLLGPVRAVTGVLGKLLRGSMTTAPGD